jgi:hypothetical protein
MPDDSKLFHFIQAQARVAFSKVNRNAGMEVEDFIAIGYETLEKAKKTYRADNKTKFNTYFTMLLQRDFYHVIAASHRRKRGGAGTKEDDVRFGRAERWENGEAEKEVAYHVTLTEDEFEEDGKRCATAAFTLASPMGREGFDSTTAEFNVLVEQIAKRIPADIRVVFKQMVSPDAELLALAAQQAGYVDKETQSAVVTGESATRCTIDNQLMADYLHMDVAALRTAKKKVQSIVAKQLGI